MFYIVNIYLKYIQYHHIGQMMAKASKKSTLRTSNRDPRERFVSLANNRVTAAINQIRLVGNLSNRKNYEYSAEDVAKITRALQRELDELKAKFKGEEKSGSNVFSL